VRGKNSILKVQKFHEICEAFQEPFFEVSMKYNIFINLFIKNHHTEIEN